MGVKACDRNGCENILCDHYSSKYGYICYSCMQDLKVFGPTDIREWMKFPITKQKDRSRLWDELIEHEFYY